MASISYALIKYEFLSGRKTCTRRDWPERYRLQWQKWFEQGRVDHTAWDKVPYAGGKRIGTFRLTCSPYPEMLSDMPLEDLEAEGGMCKSREEFCELIGKKLTDVVTVIRFIKTSTEISALKTLCDIDLFCRNVIGSRTLFAEMAVPVLSGITFYCIRKNKPDIKYIREILSTEREDIIEVLSEYDETRNGLMAIQQNDKTTKNTIGVLRSNRLIGEVVE